VDKSRKVEGVALKGSEDDHNNPLKCPLVAICNQYMIYLSQAGMVHAAIQPLNVDRKGYQRKTNLSLGCYFVFMKSSVFVQV
jgi:hypothetical protein